MLAMATELHHVRQRATNILQSRTNFINVPADKILRESRPLRSRRNFLLGLLRLLIVICGFEKRDDGERCDRRERLE